MGKIAIEFQNISKQYALGSIGTGTLSRDLNRWWARIRGRRIRISESGKRMTVPRKRREILYGR